MDDGLRQSIKRLAEAGEPFSREWDRRFSEAEAADRPTERLELECEESLKKYHACIEAVTRERHGISVREFVRENPSD